MTADDKIMYMKIFFKRLLFIVACFAVIGCQSIAIEYEPLVAGKEIVLVQDLSADKITPENFRTAETIRVSLEKRNSMISAQGLKDLRASGSSEFSEAGLIWLKQHLGENLIIVDLRQESHGFLNGAPITWYAQDNWLNLGKTRQQALQDESARLAALTRDKSARVYNAKAVKHGINDPGEGIEVKRAWSEQEWVERHKIRYFRLTVPDHMRPANEDVDLFVAFFRTLSDKDWLHFHCRAGIGRTTTFLAMSDMMRNADRVSLEDIVARQAAVMPHYDLFGLKSKGPREEIYKSRADFLRLFYEYAKAFRAGDKSSWSEWLKKRPVNENCSRQ